MTLTRGRRGGADAVQGFRNQFLAGAAFTGDQHIDIHLGDLIHQGENLLHGVAFADDISVALTFRQRVFKARQTRDIPHHNDGSHEPVFRIAKRARIDHLDFFTIRRETASDLMFPEGLTGIIGPKQGLTARACIRIRFKGGAAQAFMFIADHHPVAVGSDHIQVLIDRDNRRPVCLAMRPSRARGLVLWLAALFEAHCGRF